MTSPRLMLISGIVLLIGGVLGLLAPLAASLAATLFVGWFFLIQGALSLWAAFKDATDRLWQAVMGVLGLILGVSFIANPLGGILSLALFVGIVLAASGATRLWMAWKGTFGTPRWALILSGLASLVLGAMMVVGIFGPAPVILGLLISLEMLFMGIALIAMRWRGDTPETLARQGTTDDPLSETEIDATREIERGDPAEPRTRTTTDAVGDPVTPPATDPTRG
ncbi:MAG: HdeD family acid-resistance protein [Shimia sp.]